MNYITNKITPVEIKTTKLYGLIEVREKGDLMGYSSEKDTSYVQVNGKVVRVKGDLSNSIDLSDQELSYTQYMS